MVDLKVGESCLLTWSNKMIFIVLKNLVDLGFQELAFP